MSWTAYLDYGTLALSLLVVWVVALAIALPGSSFRRLLRPAPAELLESAEHARELLRQTYHPGSDDEPQFPNPVPPESGGYQRVPRPMVGGTNLEEAVRAFHSLDAAFRSLSLPAGHPGSGMPEREPPGGTGGSVGQDSGVAGGVRRISVRPRREAEDGAGTAAESAENTAGRAGSTSQSPEVQMSRRVRVRPYRGPVTTEQEESAGAVEQAGSTADDEDDDVTHGLLLPTGRPYSGVVADPYAMAPRDTAEAGQLPALTMSVNRIVVREIMISRMVEFAIYVSINNGRRSEEYEAVDRIPVELMRDRPQEQVIQDVCRRILGHASSQMVAPLASAFMVRIGR